VEVELDGVRMESGIEVAWLGCSNVIECAVRRMSRFSDV
jgi:hypothetical protein